MSFKKILFLLFPPIFLNLFRMSRVKFANYFNLKIENAYKNSEFIDFYLESNDIRQKELESFANLEMHEITRGVGILLLKNNKIINVLDFGGGGGNLFHAMRRFLPKLQFNWGVVDTPELVQQIHSRLQKNFDNSLRSSNLEFFTSIESLVLKFKKVDIIIASSSIQYLEDPYAKLNELLSLGAHVLQISRMPLTHLDNLLQLTQTSNLMDNGPSRKSRSVEKNILITNKVYIPNIVKFKNIIEKHYAHCVILTETNNPFLNSSHQTNMYSIIAYN